MVIQVLSSAPTAAAGRIYYDSTLGQFGVYDGVTTAWVYFGTAAAAATTSTEGIVQLAGDLGGTGTTAAAPTVGNLHLVGDTAIGHRLTSVTDPSSAQDAATKHYVDAETTRATGAEALLAPLASPALTGSPTSPTKTALTNSTVIATTAYTDAAVGVEAARAAAAEALKLALAGGTMTGAIAMGTSKITGLGDPTLAQDAATKHYADTTFPVLAGDLGGTLASPQVINLHLAGDTSIGHKLTSVSTPTNGGDAANKDYVDAAIFGIKPNSATYVTSAALPACTGTGTGVLTVTATGVLSVDGTNNVALNDIVLVNNQVATKDNGRYTVTTAGAIGVSAVLTRTVDVEGDSATWAQQIGQLVAVAASDAAQGDTIWLSNAAPGGTLNTTGFAFVQIQSGLKVIADEVYLHKATNTLGIIVTADSTPPSAGAAGATITKGTGRLHKSSIQGDGSTTVYTITHNLGTTAVVVSGQLNNAGVAGAPVELDWAPGTTNTIVVTFPVAPPNSASGIYFVSVVG